MKSENKLHIVFVNTTKSWGGGERWHFENALYLKKQGVLVSIICSKGSKLEAEAEKSGINIFRIDFSNTDIVNFGKINRLKNFFLDKKVTKVIFNGPKDLKIAGIAAMKAKVPVRIYRRGLAKKPHADVLNIYLFKNAVTDFIVNSRETESVLFANPKLKKYKKNVHLIYNGLEAHKKTNSFNNKIPVLGNASRFVEQKGLHYLLQMASILKKDGYDFKLIIAGEGPLDKKLKLLRERYGLEEEVEFPGFINDIESFISALDIYVCSSVFEGFGFSIAEAMHAARPVVAFNLSSNPELIANGKTGFLARPFDINDFTDNVKKLLNDNKLKENMGRNGLSFAMKKFNKEKQLQKFYELINEKANY